LIFAIFSSGAKALPIHSPSLPPSLSPSPPLCLGHCPCLCLCLRISVDTRTHFNTQTHSLGAGSARLMALHKRASDLEIQLRSSMARNARCARASPFRPPCLLPPPFPAHLRLLFPPSLAAFLLFSASATPLLRCFPATLRTFCLPPLTARSLALTLTSRICLRTTASPCPSLVTPCTGWRAFCKSLALLPPCTAWRSSIPHPRHPCPIARARERAQARPSLPLMSRCSLHRVFFSCPSIRRPGTKEKRGEGERERESQFVSHSPRW